MLVTVWGRQEQCPLLWFPSMVFGGSEEEEEEGPGPFRFADPAALGSTLSRAGFEDVEVATWRVEVTFPCFNMYWAWCVAALRKGAAGASEVPQCY